MKHLGHEWFVWNQMRGLKVLHKVTPKRKDKICDVMCQTLEEGQC